MTDQHDCPQCQARHSKHEREAIFTGRPSFMLWLFEWITGHMRFETVICPAVGVWGLKVRRSGD
jgi:hypothetical protein